MGEICAGQKTSASKDERKADWSDQIEDANKDKKQLGEAKQKSDLDATIGWHRSIIMLCCILK